MKSNKKSKNTTDSSSSSSSDSESNNSTPLSNNSRASGGKSYDKNSKKRQASNSSSKEYKQDQSLTRGSEKQFSKKEEDYRKFKKSRNDDSGNHDYQNQEGHSDDKKDKYKRDANPTSSKHNEDYSNRKNDSDAEKIRNENNKYKKRRDNEPSRYDHYDRNRSYHKSTNARERTRDGQERRFASTDGSRSKNQYINNSRGMKYRNRRDRSRSRSFDHANAQWGRSDQNSVKKEKNKPMDKQKPNFSLSGKLTEETNTYRGVVIKYSEPPEARKPKRRWRLYPFKGEKALQTLYIHRESAYLIGRDRKVVDLPVDHPSCSKQHAVLQYRLVSFTRDDGTAGKRVRPYIIDLESANGTFINNNKIDAKKYVELLEKDVIKFGFSSREYVLLHENSKDEAQDDDVKQEEEEIKIKEEKEH